MASKSTFSCPVCGKDVSAKAKACLHCGAYEKSGWNEEASGTDGLDLPDEDFDYEKFTAEEFGVPRKLKSKQFVWKVVGFVLLVLALIGYVVSFTFR